MRRWLEEEGGLPLALLVELPEAEGSVRVIGLCVPLDVKPAIVIEGLVQCLDGLRAAQGQERLGPPSSLN